MKKTGRKHRGGAADWSSWLAEKNPFKSTAASSPTLPAPSSLADTLPAPLVTEPVAEVTTMAKTAGRRVKKIVGGDPTSPTDAAKVLGTAPEDKNTGILGARRRNRKSTKKTRRHRK